MGVLRSISRLKHRLLGPHYLQEAESKVGLRICRVEEMESRRCMAADLQVGAVYYEDASGDDDVPDVLQITFEGGAPGTQLTRIVINCDKDGLGQSAGDLFFDIQAGGLGDFGFSPLSILSHEGFDVLSTTVADGSSSLIIELSGFDAGEKLTLSVDVDEVQFVDDVTGEIDVNALVEGAEFQRSQLVASFIAPHYEPITGSAVFFDHYDAKFASLDAATGLHLNLPNDAYQTDVDLSDRTAGAATVLEQIPLPITISGTVYEDVNLNNHQDPPDSGIAGVQLALLKFDGAQYVFTGKTATTGAQGQYHFDGVLPGKYRVVETQPSGYFSVGATAGTVAGSTRGAVLTTDILTEIELLGGDDSIRNDFAEALPASISGHVHADLDGDCIHDPEEPSLAGVTIELLNAQGNVIATTLTDAEGNYKFDNLFPAVYGVHEVQPAGYFDSEEKVGSAGGILSANDTITLIPLTSGLNAIQYDFCELLPASISGRVHADLDGDCEFDPGEPLLAGVVIELRDEHGNLLRTTQTDAQGNYKFDNLEPGIYTVHELQPAGYFDSEEKVGSAGGVLSANDVISEIPLGSGVDAVHYDFCEMLPASISGRVHADLDGDCEFDPGEPLLAGVVIELLDEHGNLLATTQTDVDGNYKFDNLEPGIYTVHELQPAGYFDSEEKVGSAGGVLSANDVISEIPLGSGVDAVHYDFCEMLPASISGRVHADLDGDCEFDPGEPLLAGVVIELLDEHGNLLATTQTDVDGNYKFDNLEPGIYTVHELQPAGYFDSEETIGSAGGVLSANDVISEIPLGSGVDAVHYDFCEMPPASISGRVHADLDGDCEFDPGEPLLAGVVIELLDEHGNLLDTTQTDAQGNYKFDNLEPGIYTVHELQPAGYFDSEEKVGSAGGVLSANDVISQIPLGSGVDAVHYDFCEMLPASISGRVHADLDGDCELDPNEVPIAGVVVHLLDANGNVIATTQTNANGLYTFAGLAPGIYGVREEQPAAYFDSDENPGSAGGSVVANDHIAGAQLHSGTNAIDYNFCEIPPGSIAGDVFQDGPVIEVAEGETPDIPAVRDGVYTPDDTPISGVTLELRNGVNGEPILGSQALAGLYAANLPIRTVTDHNGHFVFIGLPPGNYAVYEVQPTGYIDAIDTAGSAGGIAINPQSNYDPAIIEQLSLSPNNDAIIRIALFPGSNSVNNHFSEIRIVTPEIFFFPPPPPPAPPTVAGPVITIPEPIPTFAPPVIQQYIIQPIYGGSSPVLNYTWHLSVIDAGQPRGEGTAEDGAARLTAKRIDRAAWRSANLRQAHWRLAEALQGNQGQLERRLIFGMAGGIPVTGDFNGDGVTDIGVFKDGDWYIDVNGNGIWDEGDLWAKLGHRDDKPVTGDWDGDGKTDIGIYGPAWPGDPRAVAAEHGLPDPDNKHTDVEKNTPPLLHNAAIGVRSLKLTAQGTIRADLIDHVFHYGTPKDIPIVGDWNGDGIDTIAVFHEGSWYRDIDGDGKWSEGDVAAHYGLSGDIPVVGDFNGDGIDELGVFRDGTWYLDTNANGEIDPGDLVVKLGGRGDTPVVGDWNGDGVEEPGVYHEGEVLRTAEKP